MGPRRKFTDEFKREAVKLATQSGVTMSTVARELRVDRSVLSAWVRKTQQGRYEPAPGRPLKSESQAELEQVRRELARVKMERDILKKALGYFAKDAAAFAPVAHVAPDTAAIVGSVARLEALTDESGELLVGLRTSARLSTEPLVEPAAGDFQDLAQHSNRPHRAMLGNETKPHVGSIVSPD